MKKRIILIVVILLTLLCLNSCDSEESTTIKGKDKAAMDTAAFQSIKDYEYLVYNSDTKVIYYMFSTSSDINGCIYSYFAPYISENGYFCRYDDGRFVEIIHENN